MCVSKKIEVSIAKALFRKSDIHDFLDENPEDLSLNIHINGYWDISLSRKCPEREGVKELFFLYHDRDANSFQEHIEYMGEESE